MYVFVAKFAFVQLNCLINLHEYHDAEDSCYFVLVNY